MSKSSMRKLKTQTSYSIQIIRNENYELITDVFSNIIEKHAPLKDTFLRGNQAPFMTKEFRKAICTVIEVD